MAVFRVHKNANYTVMSNNHFKEKGMTLKAKGLLSLMLSLPEDWDYSAAGLVTLSKDGKDGVTAALKELERFGYLKRTQAIDESGKFCGYNYEIFEAPQPATEKPSTDAPTAENPFAENPSTENPPQLSTNKSIPKKSSIDKSNTKKKERKSAGGGSFDALLDKYSNGDENVRKLLGEWLKVRKAKRAALTDYAIELNLKKLDSLAAESGLSIDKYLEEVIYRGWQAFYAIKDYSAPKKAAPQGGGILEDYDRMNGVFEAEGGLFD